MTYKVYLAGPITGLTYDGAEDWRQYTKIKLANNYLVGACKVDTDGDGDCPACARPANRSDAGLRLAPLCRSYVEPTGIVGYSPLRAKDYLLDRGVLSGHPDAYADQVLSSAKGILSRDRWDVATCDAMLVNFIGAEKISVGTVMEIAYADAYRKPVIVAMEQDNIHHHAMLDQSVGWIADDLDFAIDLTKAILLPDGVTVRT